MDRHGDQAPALASGGPADGRLRADQAPYFFLSYAPGEDDIYIARFFRDLCDAVRKALGLDGATNVGYLDPGGAPPPYWPPDAQAALATCHTFVAVCTAQFFLSPHCGRSWGAFADRVRAHQRLTGRPVAGPIAVLWSDGGLPFLADLGVEPHPTPEAEAVRVLIRLTSHRSAYEAFVTSLAGRILATTGQYPLPPGRSDRPLDSVPDAFERHPRRLGDVDRPVRISFSVVAGTREQMRPVRANLDPYGSRREDWSPYRPMTPEPVADRAAAVAAARQIGSAVVPLESVADRIAEARQRNEIVVLLVDAWATQLDELRALLRVVNRQPDTAAVLVPTNHADPETAAHLGVLRAAVRAVFPDRGRRRDLAFHPDVDTAERFDSDLAVAIVDAQRRLLRSAAPVDRPALRPASRPILGGP